MNKLELNAMISEHATPRLNMIEEIFGPGARTAAYAILFSFGIAPGEDEKVAKVLRYFLHPDHRHLHLMRRKFTTFAYQHKNGARIPFFYPIKHYEPPQAGEIIHDTTTSTPSHDLITVKATPIVSHIFAAASSLHTHDKNALAAGAPTLSYDKITGKILHTGYLDRFVVHLIDSAKLIDELLPTTWWQTLTRRFY